MLIRQNPPNQPRAIRLPMIRQPIPAGDAVAAIARALRFRHCPRCEEDRQKLNQRFVLRPW